MALVFSFQIQDASTTIYNNYMNNKSCYVCIKPATEFVNNNATDDANMSIVDKLKFICKETENSMFPPEEVPLNICFKCECNISGIYTAKQKISNTLKFWQRFFNLSHYNPHTNDTYKTCIKMALEEPKFPENPVSLVDCSSDTTTNVENIFIKQEPTLPNTSNEIVDDLKGFLNFKDIPEPAETTVLIVEDKIGESTSAEGASGQQTSEGKLDETLGQTLQETLEQTLKEQLEQTLEQAIGQTLEQRLGQTLEQRLEQTLGQTEGTSEQASKQNNEKSGFGELIPANILANCNRDNVTPLNAMDTQALPQTSEIKFVNVSTIPGRRTIFNQVDPSIFIKDAVNNIFLCLKCNRQFAELRYLSRHLKLHCNEEDGLFRCTQCNRKFLTQSYLDKHMYCHSENAAFRCEQCSLGFTTEQLLERHKEGHSKVKKYFCEVCKRGYRMRYELTMHMEVHAGKQYPCKVCNKTFTTQRLLDKHLKRHKNPTPAKSFTCEVCGEELRGQTSLKNHLRKHNGIKFQCPHCDKFYYNQTQLKLHLCKHNNERKFACTVCDKKFYTAQILENHSYSHSEDRNFVCEFCGKTYTMKSALYIHSREHAPYKCKLCKKGFWKPRNLTAHINRVHDGDTELETTDRSSDEAEFDEFNNNNININNNINNMNDINDNIHNHINNNILELLAAGDASALVEVKMNVD